MFEEPFRWTEAISSRHSYVQEKLKKAYPVLAIPFNEGALLMAIGPQSGKVYEVYDRIAMGAMGHPADIEKMRMTLLDMSHLEGFNRSVQDVVLGRLLQFGLAPALKQNFEEVMRAPYLVQMALVEVDGKGKARFFRVNYDGHWETFTRGTVIGGDSKLTSFIEKQLSEVEFSNLPLEEALVEACKLWKEGMDKIESEESRIPETMKKVLEDWVLETAVLNYKTARKSIVRTLTDAEVDRLKAACEKI
jgi:proteasome alpha subunit